MVIKKVLKGQSTAFYREMQARTGVPAGDPGYWGADGPGTPSESEWDGALDDFIGALFQMTIWPPLVPGPKGDDGEKGEKGDPGQGISPGTVLKVVVQ